MWGCFYQLVSLITFKYGFESQQCVHFWKSNFNWDNLTGGEVSFFEYLICNLYYHPFNDIHNYCIICKIIVLYMKILFSWATAILWELFHTVPVLCRETYWDPSHILFLSLLFLSNKTLLNRMCTCWSGLFFIFLMSCLIMVWIGVKFHCFWCALCRKNFPCSLYVWVWDIYGVGV